MKAAVLETKQHIAIREVEPPAIRADDQVLIRVRTVGVCGSEVHAFNGTHPFRQAPAILGHEMAGDVVAAGHTVSRVKVGDRVVVEPYWPCGTCYYCRTGDANLCPTKRVMGTQAWPGAFGEYVVAPEGALFRLPDNLTYVQGSLIEPLTVAVHVTHRAGLAAGESVAVLGSGSIGGLIAGVSRVLGANPVIVADVKQHCLDAARERLYATHDILLRGQDSVAEVMRITHGRGVDVVCIAADDPALVRQGVEMAKGHGRIALVALLSTAPIELTGYDLIRKELKLIGNSMSVHLDVEQAIALATNAQVDTEGILTHQLPIEAAQRGLELASSKDDGAIKVMLSF